MQSIFLYLDPGSGSYLIQAIIAAVLGALFYFKNIWWRIKSFFFKPTKKDSTGNEDAHGDI
ncbi:hypothetical protein HHL16_09610 [Pseudoflavitalea sp. G-6-1-2]|nr:hypothetical protein [Pseudoflavitalea sp. G-6-1-2]